ncbi:Diphthamide biosynthesis protein [Gracilaria domingensis]|nr:Diphthamide biosynthesis protein [Gracilaria domingensis]
MNRTKRLGPRRVDHRQPPPGSPPSHAAMQPTGPPPPPRREGRYVGAGLRSSSQSGTASSSATPTTSVVTHKPARNARPRFTQVPPSLMSDPQLLQDCKALPSNYSFELPKTIHRIRQLDARRVALQMPDGLSMYATTISDILQRHTAADTVILGDITYGACCVDDLSARALGCQLLVHYGHSCLVPVQQTVIPALYVFVHIAFDTTHIRNCLLQNFARQTRLALVGTIQFVDSVHQLADEIKHHFEHVFVPQAKPLSPGELLGCTSPKIEDVDVLIYVGDGRFHLESAMIANPHLRALRYDPYSKKLTEEKYSHSEMRSLRRKAVNDASSAQRFGIILGTLGRQGSPKILERVLKLMHEQSRSCFVVLLSEITPAKIQKLEQSGVEAWVQIACPRLSIDWGHGYGKRPLLTTYEAHVALGKTEWREVYPMDFYSKKGGEWSNYYKEGKDKPMKNRVKVGG